jgi:F-type H+-transporting ATPase subunit delta
LGDAAVALRYAEALYELAKDAGRTGQVLAELAEVKAAMDRDREGYGQLLRPRLSLVERESVLVERFVGGRDVLVANTLKLLVRRRRESVLRDFFRVYLETHEDREGILRVAVDTASPLEPSEAQSIRQRLEEVTGHKVVLDSRVVPEILGGMRFRVGSRLVDGSVLSRLERIERGLRRVPVES